MMNLFDKVSNVKMQIQKKRRRIENGDWGTSNHNFWGQKQNNQGGMTQGNNGWGN